MVAPGGNLGGNSGSRKPADIGNDIPQANNGILIQGSNFFSGIGTPSNSLGNNGDFFFRSDGGAGTTFFIKLAGTWTTRA